jgi:uncharacterized protein YbjT (DUF2867 family)
MRVVIAGGHGQIALRLERLLTAAGHEAVGIVRNPDHVADVEATGASAVVLDLEEVELIELVPHLVDADAAVFAAGAGPGSGAQRKDTVDRAASALLADAAEEAGVWRFVQIGSIGASPEPPADTEPVFAAYLQAKWAAEEDLRGRDLGWTILRPGRLTNDAGTGQVRLGEPPLPMGAVPRDDVAAVVLALLDEPAGIEQTLVLVGGDTPIDEAVRPFA